MWPTLLVFAAFVLALVSIVNSRPKVSLTDAAVVLIAIALLIPALLSLR